MYWPILLPQCLLHFSASWLRAWTISRKQLLTCELLERGVGLHAKPLAVLIERLQPLLSRFLDDVHGHMQDMVVYVPTPTNLPRDKHSHGLRAWPHCPGKELQVRSASWARTESMAQPSPHHARNLMLGLPLPAFSRTPWESTIGISYPSSPSLTVEWARRTTVVTHQPHHSPTISI